MHRAKRFSTASIFTTAGVYPLAPSGCNSRAPLKVALISVGSRLVSFANLFFFGLLQLYHLHIFRRVLNYLALLWLLPDDLDYWWILLIDHDIFCLYTDSTALDNLCRLCHWELVWLGRLIVQHLVIMLCYVHLSQWCCLFKASHFFVLLFVGTREVVVVVFD